MFKIKNLTVKNFLSVGNVTQAIDFDRYDLTLVLGENLDLGGDDAGARNGTGKTTIANALSYALFGQALTNIKKNFIKFFYILL
jgi:DNA repair exonuclease SbcCD ATPase subunit